MKFMSFWSSVFLWLVTQVSVFVLSLNFTQFTQKKDAGLYLQIIVHIINIHIFLILPHWISVILKNQQYFPWQDTGQDAPRCLKVVAVTPLRLSNPTVFSPRCRLDWSDCWHLSQLSCRRATVNKFNRKQSRLLTDKGGGLQRLRSRSLIHFNSQWSWNEVKWICVGLSINHMSCQWRILSLTKQLRQLVSCMFLKEIINIVQVKFIGPKKNSEHIIYT